MYPRTNYEMSQAQLDAILEHKLRAELQKWVQAFEGRRAWPIYSTRELLFHNQENDHGNV